MAEDRGKANKYSVVSMPYQLIALGLLMLFSVVVVISAIGTYEISIDGAKNLMEKRAIDIAVNIGITLDRFGLKEGLLPEVVRTEKRGDLAFLGLYDQEGMIILHSNPKLIGREQKDAYIEKVIKDEVPSIHFSTLATGEDVFILDFPFQLHKKLVRAYKLLKKRIDKLEKTPYHVNEDNEKIEKVFCLRVAIHPYPAEGIVRKANFQIFIAVFSLIILWVITFFFFLAWRRGERLEAMLYEQERLASLGEMAAVLAHEIRNPLSSIKGFAQFHLEEDLPTALRQDMEIIVDESKRLERLTLDLLAYARPARPYLEVFEIEKFCKDIRSGLIMPADNIILTFSCDHSSVYSDKAKLTQIALNLTQNAIDAIGEQGGRVEFRLKYDVAGLVIRVEDNGPGLPDAVKERLFEPFVTTKARGTGLGLGIVKRLVESMGGSISFKDLTANGASPKGTVVEVVIPVSDDVTQEGAD
ncbi:MAG: ATP-binding protein [Desulfobacteraceae bacterium]|nr:ATP-binding protein [Desulfobacteraceae bacterium]